MNAPRSAALEGPTHAAPLSRSGRSSTLDHDVLRAHADERLSAWTHGVGLLFAVVGAIAAVAAGWGSGDPLRLGTAAVFGVTMVGLYMASTLYHATSEPQRKRRLRIADHIGVYALIAGSYTPFTLVTLQGEVGYTLFAVVWALAILGSLFEYAWVDRPKWLSAAVYIGLGWLIMFAVGPLFAALPRAAFQLLVAGGIFYTVGTVFYVAKRIPHNHAVWHLWVMGGTACHAVAITVFVVP